MSDLSVSKPADPSVEPQVSGGKDNEELTRAQRERPAEQVGAAYGHGAVRRTTADETDPHRDWTVQSGRPFPQESQGRTTRFHPSELPDPQKAVDAGLMPQVLPPQLIDANHITQPPSDNVPLDHPLRRANSEDAGYDLWKRTTPDVGLEDAQRQRRMQGSWEDRNGEAGDIDPDSDLPEVGSEYDRAEATLKAREEARKEDSDKGGESAAQGGDPQGTQSGGNVEGEGYGPGGSATV